MCLGYLQHTEPTINCKTRIRCSKIHDSRLQRFPASKAEYLAGKNSRWEILIFDDLFVDNSEF